MKMGMNSIYIFLSISLNLFSNIICGNQVLYNVSSSGISSSGKTLSGISNNSTISHNIWPPTDSELDNEFEKRVKNVGWSTWSEWSTCSRSCDGGVAQQLRRCHSQQGCRGERVRYKICNMQSCPEMQDFRAHQCSAYDDVPYDSTLFKWTPHYDYAEPCALTCRGRPAHLKDDNEESDSIVGLDDEPSVIVQLAGRVQDGTRCRTGSLDMCIQGKCQRVGCDLKIGSAKKVDACGICGGDGSSCSQTLYQWEIAPMSLCSVTCGGGYKMSRPTCSNRITGMDVEESLCSIATRPEPSVVQCNTHMCPAKWITDEWSPCSKSCGNGMKERAVVCIEESNGIRNKVPDETCRGVKPITMEPCNVQDCSNWITKDWSGCSVSCGSGLQQRIVECIDAYGTISITCDQKSKPVTTQECSTGISCSTEKHEPSENSNIEDMDNERFNADDPVHVHRLTKSYLHQDELPPISSLREQTKSKYTDEHQRVPSEATFIKDAEWSPCSVTCGEGYRTKHYRCKIYLEFSRTTATLNDSVCSGSQKPVPEVERCIMESCSLAYGDDNNPRFSMKVGVSEPGKSYIWVEQGYTSCSASCLGGVEELIINCVREDTSKVVSPFLCAQETKPEARIRTCNDRPCPPRWNYSDYTACTKSCGIGIREREVQCIHEVTRGGENTMIVPNNMCPQPPPTERVYCNVLDCPVRWETSEWSRCSKSCGGGIKERRVECKQIMVQDHKIERRPEMCPSQKPPDKKPCNTKQCAPDEQRPHILTNNSTFIQHDPRKNRVTVTIGQAATVFYGIQIKIKCPVKRYNRTKIRWSKDNQYLGKSKRIKISKKGALRILDVIFRDAGKYGCHAGLSSAEFHLSVKPKPGDELSNAEYLRYKTEEEQFNSRDSTRADSQQSPYAVESKNGETNDGNQSNVKSKQRETNRNSNKQSGLHEDVSNLSDENEEQLNDDNPHTAASSSGTRTIALPHFQHLLASLQFLWPFQSFSNSKGHRLLMEYGGYPQTVGVHRDGDRLEKDEPVGGFSLNALQSKGSDDIIVLGSGSRENVKFEWFISPWSTCSQTCGSNNGYKTRKAYCMVRLNNATQNVDNHLCSDAGLSVPEIIEKCGNSECPRWITNDWQLCLQSRCLRQNTSIQKRTIFCKFTNGTISNKCEKHNRPISQQECFNERCKGIWRVEPWSECNAACGRQGSKFRILKCVWYGTRRPAGDECKLQQRPAVIKLCKGPPCISNFIDCKDTSRYCKNAKSMGFCRLHRYQQKCCRSCRLNFYNNMK